MNGHYMTEMFQKHIGKFNLTAINKSLFYELDFPSIPKYLDL